VIVKCNVFICLFSGDGVWTEEVKEVQEGTADIGGAGWIIEQQKENVR
jgi:hypothetical protein